MSADGIRTRHSRGLAYQLCRSLGPFSTLMKWGDVVDRSMEPIEEYILAAEIRGEERMRAMIARRVEGIDNTMMKQSELAVYIRNLKLTGE